MKLSELSKEIDGELRGEDAEITSLCIDSRVAGKGDLFFCFRGRESDSHFFADEAVRRGVSAIVCERALSVACPQLIVPDGRAAMAQLAAAFYGHPERDMKFIGVTGTNGKTTVTHMVHSILTAARKRVGMIGTLGASYQDRTLAPTLTTPDPMQLFSLLSDMKKAGTEYVVMESSAHALALGKEKPICYEVAIFTNFTQDHLDFFGDMKAYGEAKMSMFTPDRCKFAVLNADDPFSEGLMKLGAPFVTYGLENPADCFAVIGEETLGGTRAVLNLNDELCETEIALTGRHNVYNALAAAACARKLGIRIEFIARGIASLKHVDGRLERVALFRGAELFVDFAHTPDGLEKSLLALKEHCRGRLVIVFGCGGNRDRGKRPLMGETAARHCDFAIITSDNPRFEDPCSIISEIEAGYQKISDQYVAIEDRERAIEYAVNLLKKDDVLLVAGKGGETTQEIMGIKYSFTDKAVIETILRKLRS